LEKSESKVFLYKRVYQELKEKIMKKDYSFGDLLPSEREIGETFNVDRTTVRKSLKLLVEDELVEKKAGKGTIVIYNPNVLKNEIKQEEKKEEKENRIESKTIAFLLPKSNNNNNRITQPFYSELFYTAEKSCQKHGYSLIYSTLAKDNDFEKFISSNSLAGIIFVSNIEEKYIESALELKIPAVLVNGYHKKIPSLSADNFSGMYEACKYLIKMGHKKIGIINGCSDYMSNKERLRGCITAMREHGIILDEKYVLGGNSWEFEDSFKVVKEMLLSSNEYPTAILGFNDRLALGAIQAIQQFGLNVPEDISVIGFDNSDQAKYSVPQITTVESNVSLIAKATISMLFQQIVEYNVYPLKILTPVELIIRDSVKKIG
jgi:GntR family transcriptional regulator of arabinose operon